MSCFVGVRTPEASKVYILCLIKVEMYLDLRIAVQLDIVVKSITDAENLLTVFLTI